MKNIQQLLAEHPFFEGMPTADVDLIGACGDNYTVAAGEYIARENSPADHFFIIRSGRVAVEIYVPNHGPLCLQTLQAGDIFGWSWLFPPYQWTFDARAVSTVHMVRLDGKCLRNKCNEDTRLGFELMKRFARIMTARLQATRLQLLDVYGDVENPAGGVG